MRDEYWNARVDYLASLPNDQLVRILRDGLAKELEGLAGVDSLDYARELLQAFAAALAKREEASHGSQRGEQ